MRKILIVTTLLTALLAACSSGVKLSDVPVEDKSNATAAGIDQNQGSAVTSVTAEKAGNGIGPVGVSHVVYFDYDSFVIKAESQTLLEAHARYMRADKNRRISIEGHADERLSLIHI